MIIILTSNSNSFTSFLSPNNLSLDNSILASYYNFLHIEIVKQSLDPPLPLDSKTMLCVVFKEALALVVEICCALIGVDSISIYGLVFGEKYCINTLMTNVEWHTSFLASTLTIPFNILV
jgi:hypothetical protein